MSAVCGYRSWKIDHYKVADARRLQRLTKQRQQLLHKLYPFCVVSVPVLGILAALYALLGGPYPAHTSWGGSGRRRQTGSAANAGHSKLDICIWGVSSSSSQRSNTACGSPTRRIGGIPNNQAPHPENGTIDKLGRLQQQYQGMRRLAP